VTGQKLFYVKYLSLKATGKLKTVIYDINALLPGATAVSFIGIAPIGSDTIAIFLISDPVLVVSKGIACSRGDGTFCEVTAVLSYNMLATQNAIWVVDGTVFQRVTKIGGALTNTRTDVPSSGVGAGGLLISVGLTSIGGIAGDAYAVRVFRVYENLNVTTKSYSSADVATLTGVAGTYGAQLLSVVCTDADVVSCSYWGLNAAPFPIVGVRATLAGLSILVPPLDSSSGQMIDGGNLGDGLYGVCYYSGTFASYAYTIKAFDAAGTLQDTTEIVNTNTVPSTVGVVGASSRCVYVWDFGDYTNNYKLRKFDRSTKKWGVVLPSSAWSSFAPFVYATPDVDFIFQRATSPTRTVITSAADPTFTVTLTGLWDNPIRVYYNAKTRTLVIANQIAVINVGRKDMAFVQPTAFVFKPPTIADASASFISAYQRPASNTQSAVFTYPQAESWGQLWDTQVAAMQPSLPP
jgi:hypothetical protein